MLTDKTGTLTQNEMIFKRISLETIQYSTENLENLRFILKKQMKLSFGPMEDIALKVLQNENEGKKKKKR